MKQPLFATAALGAALLVRAAGGTTVSPLQTADLAWERGDYVDALRSYLHILASPDAENAFESIALQTGELYRTIELTPDGAVPQFSPDGRYIAYETGALAQRRYACCSRTSQTDTSPNCAAGPRRFRLTVRTSHT